MVEVLDNKGADSEERERRGVTSSGGPRGRLELFDKKLIMLTEYENVPRWLREHVRLL